MQRVQQAADAYKELDNRRSVRINKHSKHSGGKEEFCVLATHIYWQSVFNVGYLMQFGLSFSVHRLKPFEHWHRIERLPLQEP